MGTTQRFVGLDALVAHRGSALLGTAALLAGSRIAGEDLLQTALERLMRHWRSVRGDPEIYLRRTIYHLAIDQWRQHQRRPEVLGRDADEVERGGQQDDSDLWHLRQALVQSLGELPPRQRAVLVLRYWEQFSEAESAEILGCSVGTIKSTAARGLIHLREIAAAWAIETAPTSKGTGR